MICPNCGFDNAEESSTCAGCGTKFNYLHSFNDPEKVRFFDLSKFKGKKQRAIGFFLVLMPILIILWMVLSWLNGR